MTNCPSCGAPMRMDPESHLLVCAHCGTQQQPPTLIEPVERKGDTDSPCPICGTPLAAGRLSGFEVLTCTRCAGVLVAMNLFIDVIDAMRAAEPRRTPAVLPRNQNPDERRVPCPYCRRPMTSHIYGGPGNAVIESCEYCHVNWLDAGEIRRIARAHP